MKVIFGIGLLFFSIMGYGQSDTTLEVAKELYSQLKYKQCEGVCSSLLKSNARLFDVLKLRGDCRNHLGDYELAISDYQEAEKIVSTNKDLYKSMGAAWLSLGAYKKALNYFDKVIEIDPNDAIGYFNRGCAYYLLFKNSRAIEEFNKAVELDNTLASAYYYRGVSKGELDDTQSGITDIKTAISLDSNLAEAKYNIGVLEYYAKNYSGAIKIFTEVIDENNKFVAEAYYFRGESYYAIEDGEMACADWKKGSALGDNDAIIQQNGYCLGGKKKVIKKRSSTITF